MPIYEFECTRCPSHFELKRSFHDETPVSCPTCGKKARRRFSSVPIIFKGSGFYVTDHKGSQNYTSTAESSEEAKGVGEERKPSAEASNPSAEAAKTAKAESAKPSKAEAKVGSPKGE